MNQQGGDNEWNVAWRHALNSTFLLALHKEMKETLNGERSVKEL